MKIYEHHSEPLIRTWKFVRRVVLHHIVGVLVFALILAAGTAVLMLRHGFLFEDAVMEASMLSTGMGPVNCENIHTADGSFLSTLFSADLASLRPSVSHLLRFCIGCSTLLSTSATALNAGHAEGAHRGCA